jgi:hypothetical protein
MLPEKKCKVFKFQLLRQELKIFISDGDECFLSVRCSFNIIEHTISLKYIDIPLACMSIPEIVHCGDWQCIGSRFETTIII